MSEQTNEVKVEAKRPVYPTYWAIVWEQFKKNTPSYIGMWCVILLVFIAVYAPVLASEIPFFWRGEDGGISFPWFSSLLFNRNIYSNGIDIFFNLFLVTSPLIAASWIGLGFKTKKMTPFDASKARRKYLSVLSTILLICLVILVAFMEPRTAVPDYRALALDPNSGTGGFFPPIRIQYGNTLFGVEGPGIHHLLGTDDAGRDIFVRLLFGTRVSLSVGLIAVSIYIVIGTFLGSIAGYVGGRTDLLIQRLVEVFLSIPSLLLILTLVGFLDRPSIIWIMVIIGLIGWTRPARLVRGEFLRLKNVDFVAAAKACGLPNSRIIFRHILPNAAGPVLVNATFGVASAILTESTLAFLGLGDPTLPSWGRILAFGRSTGNEKMMLIAGFCVFFTVSAFNLAGEGIRDALDPKLRK